jgi:ribosome recycling factor
MAVWWHCQEPFRLPSSIYNAQPPTTNHDQSEDMDFNDLKGMFGEVKTRMDAAIERARKDMANIRTGRASAGMLDNVHVEAYGSKVPLNQVATASIPEPAMIVVTAFDKSLVGAIEKAIRLSDLGLNPSKDGNVVRVPIPSLTDERRKELSRHVHKQAEEGRNGVRAVRRDANERLKKLLKEHKISEDDERKGLEQIQKVTDEHVKLIDELQKKKDDELLGR